MIAGRHLIIECEGVFEHARSEIRAGKIVSVPIFAQLIRIADKEIMMPFVSCLPKAEQGVIRIQAQGERVMLLRLKRIIDSPRQLM